MPFILVIHICGKYEGFWDYVFGSVDQDDQYHRSKMGLLRVLVGGRPDQLVNKHFMDTSNHSSSSSLLMLLICQKILCLVLVFESPFTLINLLPAVFSFKF